MESLSILLLTLAGFYMILVLYVVPSYACIVFQLFQSRNKIVSREKCEKNNIQ